MKDLELNLTRAPNSNYTAVTNALKPSCSNNQNNETPGTVLEFFLFFCIKMHRT